MTIRRRVLTSRDQGQNMLEYVALTVVAVAVLSGVFIAGGGYRLLPPRMEYAICRAIGGECAVSATELPGTPDVNSCTVSSELTEHVERTKVVIWSDEDRDSTLIGENPEGGVSVTNGDKDSSGVDVKLGVGVKVNGIGLGASVGGGYLWTGDDQQQVQFESSEQQAEYQERVESETVDFFEEHGIMDLSDEQKDELADIPRKIAEDMGVPYSRLHADGGGGFVEGEASIGVDDSKTGVKGLEAELGISAEYAESTLIGTGEHYDAEGNMTTSEYRQVSSSFGGNLGVNVDIVGVGPQAEIGATWDDESIVEVKYDADGNPTELVVTNTRQFHVEGGAGVGVSISPGGRDTGNSDNPQGGDGYLGKKVNDGDVVVSTSTIPLRSGDQDVVDDFIHGDFGERMRAAADILPMYERSDTVSTVQQYDSAKDSSGVELSGSVVVELGAYENTTTTQSMDLESAMYRDPATGQMETWVECEGDD